MKILLLGDFSGVHVALKKGLEKLGHDVTLVSKGDGFKKLSADVTLYTRKPTDGKLTGAYREIKDQLRLFPKLKNYDVLQTASYQFFHNRIDSLLFKKLFTRNHKTILLNTACSVPYNRFVKTLNYSPCASCKKYDLPQHTCVHEQNGQEKKEYDLYARYSGIVSTHFEYYQALKDTPFQQKNHLILLPVDTNLYSPCMPATDAKICIYYGEIRKGFKGGEYIEEALDKLEQSPWGKHVEIIRTRKLAFNDYLKILDKAHILIDQANSYSYGMNALIGLAKGKIVLSGNESITQSMYGTTDVENPMINILPDTNVILSTLIQLLENRSAFAERSQQGRMFVEKHHNIYHIAKQYENLYLNL